MTDDLPAEIRRVFDRRDAFEADDGIYTVTTTVFDATVSAEADSEGSTYHVRVRVPTLPAATADDVGPTVAESWLETFERRVADAPKSTRARVDLESFSVSRDGDDVGVEYTFTWSNPERGADIAKTFVEYVEGTYVEGVVPGYDYVAPVADLLSAASQGDGTGTPL